MTLRARVNDAREHVSGRRSLALLVVVAGLLAALCPIMSQVSAQVPVDQRFEAFREAAKVTSTEGAQVPLGSRFLDEAGQEVVLNSFINGTKPVLLSLVYFTCPSLCNLQMDGEVDGLRRLDWNVGDEFEVVVISMDPRDKPADAARRKAHVVGNYTAMNNPETGDPRPEGAAGWHFLTGEEDQIRAVADAIGFGYAWQPEMGEYAHSAAVFVTTPDGKLSRVLAGVRYETETMKMALLEASGGKVGSIWEHLSMMCVSWDPATGQYGTEAMVLMRIAGLITLIGLLVVVLLARRRRKVTPEHKVALGMHS